MIDRYSLPDMAKIWSLENKFEKWKELEIYACEAHAKNGDIPKEALKVIQQKAAFTIERIAEIEKETNHDVIAFLTSMAENIGFESRFVHMGLTSSDVGDTCLSVLLKEAGELLLKDIEKTLEAVKVQGLKHKQTIMIGRTHGIHAEPMTFGLKMALWYEELKRDKERLEKAVNIISVGKISGAVGTYANINPKVEEYVCKKMGLKPSPIATQVLQRDRHAEFLTTLAIVASSLEKFATEIRNLQRTDINEVAEPFGRGQKGSSAMPHKRNPIICERITGLARVIRGYALAELENNVLWHERDITHSSAERIIFPDATGLLHYMFHKFIGVIEGLEVYPENMKTNLNKWGGIVASQRVLLKLIAKGKTREEAYEMVQRMALNARDENGSFKNNISADKEIMSLIPEKELAELFDFNYSIRHAEMIIKKVFAG